MNEVSNDGGGYGKDGIPPQQNSEFDRVRDVTSVSCQSFGEMWLGLETVMQ